MKEKILNLTKKNKKRLLYLTIVIFMLTTLLSYAYLASISSGVTKTEISGTGDAQETLVFTSSGDLNFELNSETFGVSASDIVNAVTATVTATGKGNGEVYSGSYNAYIVLDNEFVYSDGTTPEIILTITDENGNEITEVDGLTYSSLYNGFDITTSNGSITLFSGEEISTSTQVTETWTFTVTLIAHIFDQSINEGANFIASIYLSNTDEPVVPESNPVLLADQILMNEEDADGNTFSSANAAITYINSKTTPDFSTIADEDEGIFATTDNDGTSYYFRGATEDNYVEFAGMLWRIIRIDGLGNIKLMLYSEDSEATSYQEYGITGSYDVGFNRTTWSAYYSEGDGTTSAKYTVENWYEENLTDYSDYLVETNYCIYLNTNETTALLYVNNSIEETSATLSNLSNDSETTYNVAPLVSSFDAVYYGAYYRLASNKTPSLICDSGIAEIYEYENIIGLLSGDEASFAGGVYLINNTSYYLFTGYNYWSGSAFGNLDGLDYSFLVNSSGSLLDYNVGYESAIFPSVSLSFEINFTEGAGSKKDPYVVK